MSTFSFQIPDNRDRDLLLALLSRFGIRVADDVARTDNNEIGEGTFFGNAKRHIAKQQKGVSPTLSTDIDRELYGG